MINESNLLDKGYKIFPSGIMHEYANCLFQKKVSDEDGIKYYINFYEYSSFEENKCWYSVEVQFYYYNRVETLTIENMKDITIEQIEKMIETKWFKTDCGYYDLIR